MGRAYQLRTSGIGRAVAFAIGCFVLTSCSGIDSSVLDAETDPETDSEQISDNQQSGTSNSGSGTTQNSTSNSTTSGSTTTNSGTSGTAPEPTVAAALPLDAVELAKKSWASNGPFNDWTNKASERFTGKETLAVVDENTAGKFVDSAILGVFRRSTTESDAYAYDGEDILGRLIPGFESGLNFSPEQPAPASGLYNCNGGNGSAQVQVAEEHIQGRTQTVLLATLNNCDITYKTTTNGEVAMAFDIVDGVPSTSSIAFDDVEVKLPNQKPVYLTGTHVKQLSCEKDYLTTTNMLVKGESISDQLFFDDVQRSAAHASALGCPDPATLSWDTVTGTIWDNFLGSVYISTTAPLQFSAKPGLLSAHHEDAYTAAKLVQENGAVEVVGLGDSTVTYSQQMSQLLRYTASDNEPIIAVTLESIGLKTEQVFNSTLGGFEDGGLSRLKDSDNDGLHDSWESLYELDAQNPSDAESDVDADGFTALDEYNAVTNPKNDREKNESYERYISIDLGADADAKAVRRIAVSVIGSREYKDDPYLEVDWYELKISGGDARWGLIEFPENCEYTNDVNVILCSFSYANADAQLFESPPVFINYTDGETVTVDASFVHNPYYRDNPFESNTKERNFTSASDDDSDFAFSAGPEYSTSEEEYESFTTVRLTQTQQTVPHDLLLLATFNTGLVATKATFKEATDIGATEQNCRVATDRVVCELIGVGFEESYDVKVYHKMVGTESVDLNWRLVTPDTAVREDNDVAKTVIDYMQSATRLEEIIAGAEQDSTVVLPAGDYSGKITIPDLWDVNILGAESPERTRLFSYEVIGDVIDEGLVGPMAEQTTIGRLDMHTAGAPVVRVNGEDVTVHDSLISPTNDMPHQMNNLVIAGAYDSYRLLNNRISGWGEGYFGRCDSLVSFEKDGRTTLQIFVERNLFVDNECNSIIRHGTTTGESRETADIYVNNNTFVNNPFVFLLAPSDGYEKAYFFNNIVHGAYNPMSIVNGVLGSTSRYEFVSSRNIVWGSNKEELFDYDDHIAGKVDVRMRDLHEDPLFSSTTSGVYTLSFISPAIDAGAEPEGYYSKKSLVVDSDTNLMELEARFAPIDQIDIGAFEYTP